MYPSDPITNTIWVGVHPSDPIITKHETQESIATNMSDRGEKWFRLGDFEVEDNHKGITSAEPIAVVSPSADKGKQVAEPSE
ncbi:hypothetical protein Tco_1245988 [Tanacetum coccineum]